MWKQTKRNTKSEQSDHYSKIKNKKKISDSKYKQSSDKHNDVNMAYLRIDNCKS